MSEEDVVCCAQVMKLTRRVDTMEARRKTWGWIAVLFVAMCGVIVAVIGPSYSAGLDAEAKRWDKIETSLYTLVETTHKTDNKVVEIATEQRALRREFDKLHE
jgi:hypothetical protein